MNLSRPFDRRPVASSMIAVALVLVGALAYTLLPVSPLPQVDFPTIRVNASLPGAGSVPVPATASPSLYSLPCRSEPVAEKPSESAAPSGESRPGCLTTIPGRASFR